MSCADCRYSAEDCAECKDDTARAVGAAISQPACNHGAQAPRFPPATNRANLRRTVEVGVWRIPLEVQQAAMGIDWMALENLSQAIPPAYAEHIGMAALVAMQRREAA